MWNSLAAFLEAVQLLLIQGTAPLLVSSSLGKTQSICPLTVRHKASGTAKTDWGAFQLCLLHWLCSSWNLRASSKINSLYWALTEVSRPLEPIPVGLYVPGNQEGRASCRCLSQAHKRSGCQQKGAGGSRLEQHSGICVRYTQGQLTCKVLSQPSSASVTSLHLLLFWVHFLSAQWQWIQQKLAACLSDPHFPCWPLAARNA